MIMKNDDGPVFYAPKRVGRNKKKFRMYKFRTMVPNADRIGGPTTGEKDPRITPMGHFLRRYKLDELPQLFNVLYGTMSLVGPRPEIPSEVETLDEKWDVIFSVKPGITDWSSIEFRDEGKIIAQSDIDDPHEAYRTLIQPRKLQLQKYYAENHNVKMDLRILMKTFKAVL
jgi:lipopolysaccharide/colanic/teichoic acid biosynthesis glycosyltransferase